MSVAALFVWNLVKPYVLWIALGLAAVVTVLGVLARAKHAGVIQERTEATIAAAKNVQRQNEAKAKAPHSTAEVSKALRKGKF